jgi:hypothetical protein
MTKKLARLLRADIQETSDLKSIAAMLAGKGRGGDTLLAHITPKEVGLLKEAGGAGTVNPDTGLLEFYDWSNYGSGTNYSSSSAPASSGGYYDSLPAATQGVYGSTGLDDYYQMEPQTSQTYAFPPAQEIFDSGYTAPSAAPAVPTYTGTAPGGFINKENLLGYKSEGASLPANIPVNAPQLANKLYQMPPVATSRPIPIGIQTTEGAGTDALRYGTSPDVSRAGTPEKPFLSNEQMVRLGLTGGLGVYGAMQQGKSADQIKKITAESRAIAKPYQDEGKRLIDAAKSGELTPASAQQYQALQAQLAQGASQRGGVGVAQAAAQAEAFKNQLLQSQYDYGLKVSSIGDNIALGAIRTGMQLDQQLNQANMAFYTQLGTLAAGVPTYRV